MKKQRRKGKRILLAFIVIAVGGYLYMDLRDFLGLTTLSLSKAESAWGNTEFTPETFKNGSQEQRASQVVTLIRSKRYIGEKTQTVISELGPHDAYYNSDEIPAYSLAKINGNSWDLVFLPGDAGTIREVIIHKECCYHGPLNLFFR